MDTPEKTPLFYDIQTWSKAKVSNAKNEDCISATPNRLILADGATDKTGFLYPDGRSGGLHVAEIVTKLAASSDATGYELAQHATEAIRTFYQNNHPAALDDPSLRASTTLICASLDSENLVITQIGDSNFRVTFTNGRTEHYTNDKLIDTENAERRRAAIEASLMAFERDNNRAPTDAERKSMVDNGRAVILERLKGQYALQNTDSDPVYGFGILDGATIPQFFIDKTPTYYVKTYTFPATEVRTVEIASDGFYGAYPNEPTIEAYEALYHRIHASDPDKYIRYLSTKSLDDASVVIAQLSQS